MQVKIAHVADVHLGVKCGGLGNRYEQRNSEITSTFYKILKICEYENVDFLLIAGDLFDDIGVYDSYLKELKRAFSKVNFKIIIAPGNHDPYTPDSPYGTKWPKNVFIFKSLEMSKISFPEYDLDVWGSAFCGPYKSKNFIARADVDSNKLNICVMHGNLSNAENESYCPISAADIENSNMDYIALGHIHKRSNIGCVGKTHFAYPGCPEGSGFDESGEKGFYIGTIGKGVCDLEFKKVCRRTYQNLEIDISNFDSEYDIIDKILGKMQELFGSNCFDNIYKITLTGYIPEDSFVDISSLETQINDKVFFAKLIDKTETEIDVEKLKFRNDFKSIFIKKMLGKIEAAITDEERKTNKLALKLGLRAFERDVKYNW